MPQQNTDVDWTSQLQSLQCRNVSWPVLVLPYKKTANRTEFYGGK